MISPMAVTAIIMTYNEEINLPACLESISDYVKDIVVVDSYSNDATISIAKKYTDKIYQNKFINQAVQFNWALENADISNEWILRIDADERWTTEGFKELIEIIDNDIADGVFVRMKIFFMGKWIRHGGFYPNLFLRVYKKSKGTIENRWMDEHINVDGRTAVSNIDVIEANYDRQKHIGLWTIKHNNYSTREAVEYLLCVHNMSNINSVANLFGNKTERKRWLKENLYSKIPLFTRPVLYFIYRYFFKFGFLDGKEGFIFHTLHAFWYRFLVDTKIYQIEKIANEERKDIRQVVKEHYGLDV